ncbi:PAS domain-containing sensor histidine kinase [Pseudogulbenkiania sp. MAI-1]|uniref:PAS domain-containing sensor histidine kinase n=1 Tax=Pseudogulbenkiania sp. MAI-1 TaxID=990370 RepID=UPI00045E5C4C|nr:PAS domain-containing sensor histidine kinase [Pseudogulbenkiania sp. MAI-1]
MFEIPPSEPYADVPFRAIVEQSLVGIYVMQDERFPYVNATFAEMFGYTPEEMEAGTTLDQFIPADFVDELRERYRLRIAGTPPAMRFVTHGLHRNGNVVLIEVHGMRIEYRGRPAVAGVAVEVTERLRNEEELRRSRAELRELAAHLNTVRENSRAHFARELHDVLGGMLTSIKMDVTRIMRRANTPELQSIAAGLRTLTQEAIESVRAISEELRSSVLDHLGLAAAVERELMVFGQRHSLACRFEAIDLPAALPPEVATAFYRIFQEATTNIVRHADASTVLVNLGCHASLLWMEIIDDGSGIDLTTGRVGAMGVLSMTERARELGGRLEIGCHPAGGTRLHVSVPLSQPGSQA